ncbi:MAG: hypothetical protein Q4C45_08745 [Oscillospiraceae bacterium]|nr:hypothetical protein [Oscillospiraceae bacterium]
MRSKTVTRTSIFPASQEQVFQLLKELKTLQYIASPYASFLPIDGRGSPVWEEGAVFRFRLRIFGVIPCGIHTIHVLRFSDDTYEIYTQESNPSVPTWNHRITLKAAGDGQTEYTDEVEIGAGWKTAFVCAWARSFYAHRQNKWIRLLNSQNRL